MQNCNGINETNTSICNSSTLAAATVETLNNNKLRNPLVRWDLVLSGRYVSWNCKQSSPMRWGYNYQSHGSQLLFFIGCHRR